MTITLADIYTISAAIGCIYLTFSALLGQLDLGEHMHGGHVESGHSGVHTALSQSGHHSAAHTGIGHDGSGHSHHGHSHESGDGELARFAISTLLSPMTISTFSAFFGLTGLFVGKLFPFVGAFSLIPATAMGILVSSLLMTLFSWLFAKTHVSTNARIDELVGQVGEVSVPIKEGRTGEITCVMGSKRYNYPAVAGSIILPAGTQVMISNFENGVVTVEPWENMVLDISEKVVKNAEQ
jgi:membrane protein implicated in regulation of membrane protease activity